MGKQQKLVSKLKDESLKRIKAKINNVSKNVIETVEVKNEKINNKSAGSNEERKIPTSNNLKSIKKTVIDENGNEIQKSLFIDDQGNIVNENDIVQTYEDYIDEFGNKQQKLVSNVKDESLKRIKEE